MMILLFGSIFQSSGSSSNVLNKSNTILNMNARSELLVKKVFVYGFTWREVEDFFLINRTFLYDELKNYFLKMPDSEERLRRFDEKIKENEKNKEKTSIPIILGEQERERG